MVYYRRHVRDISTTTKGTEE